MKKIFLFLLLALFFMQNITAQEPSGTSGEGKKSTPSSVGLSYGTFSMMGDDSKHFYDAELYQIDANFAIGNVFMLQPFFRYGYKYYEEGFVGYYSGIIAWADIYTYGLGIAPKVYIQLANNNLILSIGPLVSYNYYEIETEVSVLSIYSHIPNIESTSNDFLLSYGGNAQIEWRISPRIALSTELFYDHVKLDELYKDSDDFGDFIPEININAAFGFNVGLRYCW